GRRRPAAPPARRPAPRSASGRRPPPSPPAPIISWSAGRSSRRLIRRPLPARSSLKSPARRSHDREVEMAKGYWIPHIDVSDPEGYKAYMAATPPAHDKRHGRALVRGGAQEVVEGKKPLAQCLTRISGLRHRARLLPLRGIPAREAATPSPFGLRFRDHRGLRPRAAGPPGAATGGRAPQRLLDRARRC